MINQKIETIDIHLPLQEIEQRLLDNRKEFESRKVNPLAFKFFANRSAGTLQVEGRALDSYAIHIDGKFEKVDDEVTKITLTTKPRIQLNIAIPLYIAVVALMLFVKYYSDDDAPLLLIIFIPLIPFWFRYIYLEQEKALMRNVVEYLKLIERL